MTPLLRSWPLILTLVVAFLIYKLIKWLIWFRRYQALHNSFPGESDFHWLLGNFHLFPGPNDKGLRYLCSLAERFPKFSRMWIGPFYAILFLYHPDTIRKVLKSSAPKTRSKYRASLYDMVKPWLGEGLLISNGSQWSRNRRLLNPGFHFDILKPYVAIYNSAADVLVEKFSESAKNGKSVELFQVLSLCSLDIILQCAFSYESKCQLPGHEMEYVKAVDDLQECWMNRAMKPLFAVDWIYNFTSESKKFRKTCDFVHNVTENLIDKRRKTMETDKRDVTPSTVKKHLDFLDILLTAKDENGAGLTQLEIRSEADTFLFAGHDTTTSAMSWTLYSLATHPEYYKRVQDELDNLLKDGDTKTIQFEDLSKLVYLGQCIKEALRMHPPVFIIQRKLNEQTELDGHIVPAGSSVAISSYALHHNSHVWDKPFEYNPDRFSPDNVTKMDPFAFLPFSAGSRNCIGQNFAMHEMKVLLSRILHRFTLHLDPTCEVLHLPKSVMKAQNGILLIPKLRKESN